MLRLFVLLISSSLLISACHKDNVTEPETDPRPTMNKQDSLAMVAFYHSMRCDKWSSGLHWDLKDYQTWEGVTIELDKEKNEYRITEIKTPQAIIYLPDNYHIPPELGNLTKLRSLTILGDQRVCGGIPPEIFNCPLETLYITGNSYEGAETGYKGFSGTIPKEIGEVGKTLKHLKISGTNISGELPEEIALLNNLKTPADLCNNEFTGKVPLFLRELPAGSWLTNNKFTEMDWRYFTEDVGNVPMLRQNCLSGDIPKEVLETERFKEFKWNLIEQKGDYGYDSKYFRENYYEKK